jgi:hypothetical protein
LPTDIVQRALRSLVAVALAGLVAACGGGGGGSPPPPAPPPPPSTVTISGKITYDYVPHGPFGGLNYPQTQARPARRVMVTFLEGTTPLASTSTDGNGNYSLSVPLNRTGFIRVTSTSTQTGAPSWNFSVVDNTSNNAPYTLDGASLSSGSANSVRDLHAPSGWTGSGYGAQRAAAPFAILDTIYGAVVYIVAADPTIVFPPLNLHWSRNNITSTDANGDRNPVTGEIETSFYAAGGTLSGIYLLGEENQDSDEYDGHVILHEFGHYLDHRFGRSDNLGGGHRRGDRLDPRVAFSEGWPTAFAGLVLADPLYADAGGMQQQAANGFNMEQPPVGFLNPAPGWYSEQSVWELVYDLVDTAVDGNDTIAYPYTDLWAVLKNAMGTSKALPTIFPFWTAIKAAHPGDVAQLNLMTTAQQISTVTDDYGTGETNSANAANPALVLPVYTPITLNGPAINVCSIDDYTSPSGAINKLSSRRFLRFTSAVSGTATITVTATSIPPGEYADPDFVAHWGRLVAFTVGGSSPTTECMAVATGGGPPSTCVETGAITIVPDEFVVEVFEWSNTNDTTDPEYPPIGDTCFDVRVTQP